jgi:hypothetical protein
MSVIVPVVVPWMTTPAPKPLSQLIQNTASDAHVLGERLSGQQEQERQQSEQLR